MMKLIVFIFLFLIFGGCNKRWNYNRDVDFDIIYDISWDSIDSIFSEFRLIVEYKITNDLDGDTASVTVMDIVLQESYDGSGNARIGGVNHSYGRTHKLKNYDHLEFKVTTTYSSSAASWKHLKPNILELEFLTKSSCDFENDLELTESLFTLNSYDTTFYFNWSPPNFN